MRILKEDTVALVIDFQERLVPVMNHKEELLHNTEILLKGLKVLEIPMIVTQHYTKGIGMTVPKIQEAIGDDFVMIKSPLAVGMMKRSRSRSLGWVRRILLFVVLRLIFVYFKQ